MWPPFNYEIVTHEVLEGIHLLSREHDLRYRPDEQRDGYEGMRQPTDTPLVVRSMAYRATDTHLEHLSQNTYHI
jgi:hypothetical protein